MSIAKVLVVDDNKILLLSLTRVLELNDFEVTSANNVAEALHYINTSRFDVLLSDLHMPGPGDGLTVVSAMRHSNPLAVTMLLSSFPEMDAAAQAILLQADEILVKPMNVPALIDAIKQRLTTGPRTTRTVESVATILERTVDQGIEDWYKRVEHDDMLLVVSMTQEERCSHLPQLFRDLIARLRTFRPLGTKDVLSSGPAAHGELRRKQGYTPAMMVEESRILQVSIFNTLQNNLTTIDFSVLLIGVMTIADEVDSQLSQAMRSYIVGSKLDALPA